MSAQAIIEATLKAKKGTPTPQSLIFSKEDAPWREYWLDPQGVFHDASDLGHDQWADREANRRGGTDYLYAQGWIRVIAGDDETAPGRMLSLTTEKPINRRQREAAELTAINQSALLQINEQDVYVPPEFESER